MTFTRAAAALALALVVSALFTAPASAADPVGRITGLAGKCVDVAWADPANGTAVQLQDCNGGNAQQWGCPPR
ncbi:RICIN domain-containing protein [Streptosporangium sp. NPDC048865]|uniref:RICIN domain-containing protein n=1 Tax=Streptosporangium sp. NPDC048865 TaxID=3155766 RepID=UPI00342D266B